MTTLEKRALWGLIIGAVYAVVFFTVYFALGGVNNPEVSGRSTTAIVVIGSTLYLYLYISYRRCAKADERDRLIFIRATDTQLLATILTVGGWCAALGEINKSQGQIATGYLYLIVISMVLAGMIMQAAGILFWSRHTEHLNKV